ncbi:MAG: hypothetical protein ACXAAO_08290 [Candidatus Thorarchaeota archaeon]|jgi:hypothetical protein
MWLEIFLIPFILLIVVFFIFWIVHEGTRWQKHPQLGVFARFIQSSPKRAFVTFFLLFILLIPAAIGLMSGIWLDALGSELGPQRVHVVNVMLLMFLVLAFTFPVMYSSLGTWRNAKRAEAEMKVRPTG